MLFLLFDLDGDRYALDAREIVEVLALRPVRPVPGAPVWVAGVAQRHGAPLPVVDVPRLALGRPARQLLSTRLVIVRYESGASDATARELVQLHDEPQGDARASERADLRAEPNDGPHGNPAPAQLLGLIVESATQTRRIERAQFADTGLATPHARWLGPVANDGGRLVQWVQVQQMLNEDVKTLLFPQAAPTHEPTPTSTP
ncbi:chemotaxis protein CheW [Paraburkholderia jirisanensis]